MFVGYHHFRKHPYGFTPTWYNLLGIFQHLSWARPYRRIARHTFVRFALSSFLGCGSPMRTKRRNESYIIYVLKMFQSPSKRNLYASIVYIHVLIWNKRLCMKWVFSIGLFRLYPVLHIYVHLYICQKRCHVARCFFLTKHHQTYLKCGWIEDETNLCRDVGGHFQALDEVPLIRLNDMTLKSPWNNMPKQVDLYVFLMKRRVWHATACCIEADTKESHLAPFIRRRCGILSYLWMSTP